MNRKEFLINCGIGCIGMMGTGLLFTGCTSVKYMSSGISDGVINLPRDAFRKSPESDKYHDVVVIRSGELNYPVAVFRFSDNDYTALFMKCTHQGTELEVAGDRLVCNAHGREFSDRGKVERGPADKALQTFPIEIRSEALKIQIS